MAINLPDIGQVDWGGELNSALTQLDNQTIVDGKLEGDDLVLIANSGTETNVGSVRGRPGGDGAPGDPGPPGPPGESGVIDEGLTGVVYVDEFPGAGANDSPAVSAAINHAVENGLGTVQFAARTYHLYTLVDIPPVSGLTLQGHLGKTIVMGRDAGTTTTSMAFRILGTPGELHEDIRFTGLTFWGGMGNFYDLGDVRARSGTTVLGAPVISWDPGRLLSGISTYGDRMLRTDGNGDPLPNIYGTVRNIWVDHCQFLGTQNLPVFFRGNAGVTSVTNSFLKRSLDPGFVFCDSAIFSHNRSEYSQDNGVSLSRGCKHAVATGNTIYGAWFNGIWGAGFSSGGGSGMATADGPKDLAISGNTIEWSGQHGIGLMDYGGRVSVTGNVIYRTRPTTESASSGCGVAVNRLSTTVYPLSVVISGNVVDSASRGGIAVAQARTATITGNNLRTIGSSTLPDGVTPRPSGDDGTQNFGIGTGRDLNMGALDSVLVSGNSIINTSGGSGVVYWPIHFLGSSSQRMFRSNLAVGTAEPATEV